MLDKTAEQFLSSRETAANRPFRRPTDVAIRDHRSSIEESTSDICDRSPAQAPDVTKGKVAGSVNDDRGILTSPLDRRELDHLGCNVGQFVDLQSAAVR
jgi:hypothetical protein